MKDKTARDIIDKLQRDIEFLRGQLPVEQMECEKCGCLLGSFIKGESEIRERPVARGLVYANGDIFPTEEYIHKPLYCKRCAPKKKIKTPV